MISTESVLDAVTPRIAAFLRAFDAASGDPASSGDSASSNDPAGGATPLADLFLPTFLNVSPASASAVPIDLLIRSLPARERLFAGAGVTGLALESATETWLDDRHVLVGTTWRLVHPRATEDTPRVQSTFMLVDSNGSLRVAAYVNLTDLPAVLAPLSA